MPVTVDTSNEISQCERKNESIVRVDPPGVNDDIGLTILDAFVILFAFIAMYQCLRSLIKSVYLSRIVRLFFLKKFDYRLKYNHIMPLFNFWLLGILISNVLMVVGSTMKIVVSYYVINIMTVDITSIIMGLAVFAQWCGLLRFLSYFDKYNILLLTLRLALPSVIRFVICAGILYIAFLLCGWLVLGPYHPKFKDPTTASNCLFSLVNGDDMFNTYVEMSNISMPVWIFSIIYLYVFISLFIYVVLSVFIGLISDTYETLHEEWSVRSKGLLQDFANGQLGRAARRTRTYSQASGGGGDNNDDEYELIRDIENTPTYGATETAPLLPNGGPLLEAHPNFVITDHSHSTNCSTPLVQRRTINDSPVPRNYSDRSLNRHRAESQS